MRIKHDIKIITGYYTGSYGDSSAIKNIKPVTETVSLTDLPNYFKSAKKCGANFAIAIVNNSSGNRDHATVICADSDNNFYSQELSYLSPTIGKKLKRQIRAKLTYAMMKHSEQCI